MTALTRYERLEATGLWRPTPQDQRREVIVSIGDATLIVTDLQDRPLTHWSLAAVTRQNPGHVPAIYSPDGDPGETLELPEGESEMIEAIETLRRAVERARPHPGRLRRVSVLASVLAVIALGVFWLPGALRYHALSVVPEVTRQEIGAALVARSERVGGPVCDTPETRAPLRRLATRTGVRAITVMRAGIPDALALPGGLVAINRALLEDYEDPAIAAGYILAEKSRAAAADPLAGLLRFGGVAASFRLLTTGDVSDDTLTAYAEHVLTAPRADLPDEALLAAFAEAGIPSTPYAYARDITGETVLGLIEADPMAGQEAVPVLADRDWVLLQTICGG